MKIYTKIGDKGETSLIGGRRVSKADLRVEAYGTVDELISTLGVVRSYEIGETNRKTILDIQSKLMVVAATLASDGNKSLTINENDIAVLEEKIDQMDDLLPSLQSFILPGGSLSGAYCDVSRTVCRRAERSIVRLSSQSDSDNMIIAYLNRLSDFLFTLARLLTVNEVGKENLWVQE